MDINPFTKCNCTSLNGTNGTDILRPVSSGDCQQAIEMFKDWEAEHGLQKAREDFVFWWSSLGLANLGRFCVYDVAFKDFFLSKGIDLSTWDSKLFSLPTETIAKASDLVSDTVSDVADIVGNTTDAVSNTTASAKWIAPVALVGAVAIAGMVLHAYLTAPLKVLPK
jgi:hypothetical protein